MTTAYFTFNGKNYTKQITGISYWKHQYWMQDSEPTKALILSLTKNMDAQDWLSIKLTGELIKTTNPLFIYGEQSVNLITVNGEVVYNKFQDSPHVQKITFDYLHNSKQF